MKKLTVILGLFIFSFSGCLTNIVNCPEDILERESCPTEKQKDKDLFLWLIILTNNGNNSRGVR